MDEVALRKLAIKMYLEGKSPSKIITELNKSRPWFYKWLKRYEANPGQDWYKDHSRRPLSIKQKIDTETENLIISFRLNLKSIRYAQIGAVSIQWEFEKLGLTPPPIWTIDRVLKRNNLIREKEKPSLKTNEYPTDYFFNVHQMDFVGPRYIKNYGRFYSLNIISTDTHCAQINPIKGKSADFVLNAIVRFWKKFGKPDFLQMDNELSFRGSNRHPRSFGKVIRFLLSQQVAPIFIPLSEPWRNGIVERFNDSFDKKFFRSQIFKDLDDVCSKATVFENFHNRHHRYSAHNNRTPLDMFIRDKHTTLLDEDYEIPDEHPLIEGDIYLIRFIRSDRKLSVFSESFIMPKELVYSYVIGLISVESHTLKVYRDNKLIKEIYYPIPVDWM